MKKPQPLRTISSGNPLLLAICAVLLTSCATNRLAIDPFLNNQTFDQGFHGLVVFDPEENRILYDYNGNKFFTPASNIKLLTLYTGIMTLPDSVPALEYIVRNDSLIFKGTGDPSFLHPNLPTSGVFNFLTNRNENLFYYSPTVQEEIYGPGWAWDDYNSAYSAERSSFPVYGNLVSFSKNYAYNSLEVIPKIFLDSVKISELGQGPARVIRSFSKNEFYLENVNSQKKFSHEIPFKFSPQLLVKILSDTLKRDVTLITDPAYKMENTHIVYSIPTDSLYKRILEESDNFIAEQLLLLSARQISDTLKAKIAIQYIKEKLPAEIKDEIFWVDGSGLSRYNLITPRALVGLLSKIQQEIPRERLFDLMAKGGRSGTLKHSYIAEEPFIFAKTGTLRHNHSLSGYLKTSSGKVLIFSFMNSNYTVPTAALRKEMELILRKFYAEY